MLSCSAPKGIKTNNLGAMLAQSTQALVHELLACDHALTRITVEFPPETVRMRS